MKLLTVPSSGSVGSLVYSRNRGGQYTRNRVHPAQPVGTGRRATVRGYMTAGSHAWTTLGAVSQAAWDVQAKLTPVRDSLGQTVRLTGQQMFLRVYLAQANATLVPPTTPQGPLLTFSATGSGLTIDSSGNISVFGGGHGRALDKQCFAVSKQVSTGRRTWFTWWQVLVLAGNSVAVTSITAAYNAQFGSIVAGQRVFLKCTPVRRNSVNGVPVVTYADHP